MKKINSAYNILQNEYTTLSRKSDKFKMDQGWSLDRCIDRLYAHDRSSVGLDIGRDYLFFKDDSYNVVNLPMPKLDRSYASSDAPNQNSFDITYGNYTQIPTQQDIDECFNRR